MSPRFLRYAVLVGLLASAQWVGAHEIRPAYLEISETAPGRYAVLWRTPVLSGMRLPVRLGIPDGVRDVREPMVQELTDSLVERRTIDAGESGLSGKRIEFVGLQATITDVLVRVRMRDGASSTTLVRPSQPWIVIAAAIGRSGIFRSYWTHGVEHIIFGFDHLLFVLALVLIVRSRRVLLMTITAFTIAHSITIALASRQVVYVPQPPVEAAIALSLLLLAVEILRGERGEIGFSARSPWVVAFAFGLLHGLGFASALSDIGLPSGAVPLALLAFNLGVECGQLAFVAVVSAVWHLASQFQRIAPIEGRAFRTAPYAIGVLASFWFFERLTRF
jgi:hydrogenase/urease accessory protein HupE